MPPKTTVSYPWDQRAEASRCATELAIAGFTSVAIVPQYNNGGVVTGWKVEASNDAAVDPQ